MPKSLKNLIRLSCHVAVLVPSTTEVNQHVDNSAIVDDCLEFMGRLFNGATASNCVGTWVSAEAGLIKEQVTQVISYCTSDGLEEHIQDVIQYAENMRDRMRQESIALIVHGELYLI